MKQVFAAGGRVVVVDALEPTSGPGELLVAPAFSVISTGTGTHAIRGTARPETTGNETYPPLRPSATPSFRIRSAGPRRSGPEPRPPGSELIRIGYRLAGTVLAVGSDVVDLHPGDAVACSGNNCADNAQRVVVSRNLVVRVPPGLGLDRAAFVTFDAIVLNAVRQSGCQLGEVIGVFGLNAVLLCVATASSEPLNLAFDLCRQRGCVVGVGLFGMDTSRDRMYAHDVSFYPALAYGPGRYDDVYEEGNVDYPIATVHWTENRNQGMFLRLLASDQVQVDRLGPVRFPLEEAPRAYDLLLSLDHPLPRS